MPFFFFLWKLFDKKGEMWYREGKSEGWKVMSFLQGNTYNLVLEIRDAAGNIIGGDIVEKASFSFGDLVKEYGSGGEVKFDSEKNVWVVPLSEEETFSFGRVVKWQARFLFLDGSVDGTLPASVNVYESLNKVVLTGGAGDA